MTEARAELIARACGWVSHDPAVIRHAKAEITAGFHREVPRSVTLAHTQQRLTAAAAAADDDPHYNAIAFRALLRMGWKTAPTPRLPANDYSANVPPREPPDSWSAGIEKLRTVLKGRS
jgi:hypothetical protein